MIRILVIGAQGLLGSSLVPALTERGYDVRCASRAARGGIRMDLTDEAATWRALDTVSADVIINLVAATSVDECERDPQFAFSVNTRAVEHVVRWVAASDTACHLVQISTDQVYDGVGPHSEDVVSPVNYYALSKYAGELLAGKVQATVLRTNLFGRSRCAGRASISDWLVGVMRAGQPARVFQDVLFSPLSLQTLARSICLVVERRTAGVFNLGSKGGMSKADFAFRLAGCLGLSTAALTRSVSSDASLAARRPKDMRMDSIRFETHFGVELPTLDSEITLMKEAYASEI